MQGIPCSIDVLTDKNETCWLVTVENSQTFTTALLLSALQNELLSKVSFIDSQNNRSLTIDTHFATCNKESITVTKCWLDTVLCLFLNTVLNGWSDTAHVDQTFSSKTGEVSISIVIEP